MDVLNRQVEEKKKKEIDLKQERINIKISNPQNSSRQVNLNCCGGCKKQYPTQVLSPLKQKNQKN